MCLVIMADRGNDPDIDIASIAKRAKISFTPSKGMEPRTIENERAFFLMVELRMHYFQVEAPCKTDRVLVINFNITASLKI